MLTSCSPTGRLLYQVQNKVREQRNKRLGSRTTTAHPKANKKTMRVTFTRPETNMREFGNLFVLLVSMSHARRFLSSYLCCLPGEGQSGSDLRSEIDAKDEETVDGRRDAERNVQEEGHHLRQTPCPHKTKTKRKMNSATKRGIITPAVT